jgi:hypothetical protein
VRFYPRALIVTAAGFGLLWYALEQRVGLVFIGVDLLLTGGLWAIFPERWPAKSSPASNR